MIVTNNHYLYIIKLNFTLFANQAMRKLLFTLIAAIAILSGCSSVSVPDQICNLTAKVESKHQDYTSKDWEKTTQEYKNLINEFWNNYDKYTNEEKKAAITAIGKYHVILLKDGISDSAAALENAVKSVPGYIDGLSKTIEDNKAQISGTLEELLNAGSEIGKSLEELGSTLGNIFGGNKDNNK